MKDHKKPTPALIRQRRKEAGLSRAEAAALVYRSPRSWESWEQGRTKMDLGTWELFCFKSDLPEGSKSGNDATAKLLQRAFGLPFIKRLY